MSRVLGFRIPGLRSFKVRALFRMPLFSPHTNRSRGLGFRGQTRGKILHLSIASAARILEGVRVSNDMGVSEKIGDPNIIP